MDSSVHNRVSTVRPSHNTVRLAGLVFALAITGAIFLFRDYIRQLGTYGYLGIFLISMIGNATVILPAPTFLAAFAGGGVFNPVIVGIVAAAGASIGELTGYLAGVAGQVVIENREMYERFKHWMRRYGPVAIVILAAVPNPFFDVAGITAGALRFPVKWFLLGAWVGKTIKFLVIAYLGAGSASFFAHLVP